MSDDLGPSMGEYEEMRGVIDSIGCEAPTTWKMRNGSEIAIRAMDDGHLLNAARMVLRNVRLGPHIESLRLYGAIRSFRVPMPYGEYAREAALAELDREGDEISNGKHDDALLRSTLPIYDALREEIDIRRLRFKEAI